MDDTRLGTLLLEGNVVAEDDLEKCLEIQALTGGTRQLGQILVEQSMISAVELEELLQLQQERRAAALPPLRVNGQGGNRFLRSAALAGASELILSEGRPTMVRVAGQLRTLLPEPLQPPELWQFLRDYMGTEILEILAERRFVSQELHCPGLCRGRIMAFRHFEGACVVVRLHPETPRRAEEAGLTPAVLAALRGGKGLILVTGEAGSGLSSTLASLLQEASLLGPQLILVLDESHEFPAPRGDAIVVRRKVGRDVKNYPSGLQCAIRENPDV